MQRDACLAYSFKLFWKYFLAFCGNFQRFTTLSNTFPRFPLFSRTCPHFPTFPGIFPHFPAFSAGEGGDVEVAAFERVIHSFSR